MFRISVVLTMVATLASSVSAQTNAPGAEPTLTCYILAFCLTDQACRPTQRQLPLHITQTDTGLVFSYPNRRAVRGDFAILAETRAAVIQAIGERPIYGGMGFYPIGQSENGNLLLDAHTINTNVFPPTGLAPTRLRLECPPSLLG